MRKRKLVRSRKSPSPPKPLFTDAKFENSSEVSNLKLPPPRMLSSQSKKKKKIEMKRRDYSAREEINLGDGDSDCFVVKSINKRYLKKAHSKQKSPI